MDKFERMYITLKMYQLIFRYGKYFAQIERGGGGGGGGGERVKLLLLSVGHGAIYGPLRSHEKIPVNYLGSSVFDTSDIFV